MTNKKHAHGWPQSELRMFVYHGTSESAARKATESGIQPRRVSGIAGSWEHTAQSNPAMVYLTAGYAPYYAAATTNIHEERAALIQIDLDVLDRTRLFPDEDFIEQALSGTPLGKSEDHKRRNQYVIQHIREYKKDWKLSLENLGTVCYRGRVPAKAITKVVAYDPSKNPEMTLDMLDPIITLANYKWCGEKFRALTNWFMGEDIDPVLIGFSMPTAEDALRTLPWADEVIGKAREQLANREGLETIFDRKSK